VYKRGGEFRICLDRGEGDELLGHKSVTSYTIIVQEEKGENECLTLLLVGKRGRRRGMGDPLLPSERRRRGKKKRPLSVVSEEEGDRRASWSSGEGEGYCMRCPWPIMEGGIGDRDAARRERRILLQFNEREKVSVERKRGKRAGAHSRAKRRGEGA